MTYGIIFCQNSSHSPTILRYKREQLELLWDVSVETLAETYLKK
jgi:hypothetical protein